MDMTHEHNDSSRERLTLASKSEGVLADMLTELCLDPVWGEETLMWAFQPYEMKEDKALGFFRVWCISEPLTSDVIIYNDHPRTLHHHLMDAIIRLREIHEDTTNWF